MIRLLHGFCSEVARVVRYRPALLNPGNLRDYNPNPPYPQVFVINFCHGNLEFVFSQPRIEAVLNPYFTRTQPTFQYWF